MKYQVRGLGISAFDHWWKSQKSEINQLFDDVVIKSKINVVLRRIKVKNISKMYITS